MKRDYTILIPDMLPDHFKILVEIFKAEGYKMAHLTNDSRAVVDEGLKSVHNDTCYPALLVIGQFLEALKSGRYDVDKTALMITQTGGGCRASNYIHLLRKALKKDFPNVPVISLSFTGIERHSGFTMNLRLILNLIFGMLYGDLLMTLKNQCKPYEVNPGQTDRVLDEMAGILSKMAAERRGFFRTGKNYKRILDAFSAIPVKAGEKPRVGIVGEIYVKYSPLANNRLEEFLIAEGCEPVVPGLLDFILYCLVNMINDGKIYDFSDKTTRFAGFGYWVMYRQQKKMNRFIRKKSRFMPGHDFEELRAEADKLIHQGVKMGEGWLIPAEMGELIKTGTNNIVTAQPFGCLPNHIVAKGVNRRIKEAYPEANIVAVDYDPSSTRVNQENRIKLMIANIAAAAAERPAERG
ncbi:MAG: 2-hydroxyacyl-CoA dehydratase [Clostridiales bacterium]|nr:2-hydroxyacyl-CoA dehydratase [Clostridiales bacterium]